MSTARTLTASDLWWCLAAVALALAPHAGRLPVALSLGVVVCVSWRMLGAAESARRYQFAVWAIVSENDQTGDQLRK